MRHNTRRSRFTTPTSRARTLTRVNARKSAGQGTFKVPAAAPAEIIETPTVVAAPAEIIETKKTVRARKPATKPTPKPATKRIVTSIRGRSLEDLTAKIKAAKIKARALRQAAPRTPSRRAA